MKGISMGWGNRVVLPLLLIVLLSIAGCTRVAGPGREELPVSCDVAIVGKSLAAVTAAAEASRQGASVMVFSETDCLDPGLLEEGAAASLEGADLIGITGTVEESRRSLRQALLSSAKGSGQDWFFDLLAANSYQDVTWFSQETGLELIPESPVRYGLVNPSAEKAQHSLVDAAASAGAQFIDQVTVTGIEQNESPPFFTIRLNLNNGLRKEVSSRSVILADGGYLNHPALLQTYASSVEPAPWRQLGTGKGLQLANDLHLDLVQLNHFSYGLGVQQNGQWAEAAFPNHALLVAGRQIIPVSGKTREQIIATLQEDKQPEGYLVVAESQLTDFERRQFGWPVYAGISSFIEHYRIDCPNLARWYSRPEDSYRGTRIKVLAEYCLGGVAVTGSGQVLRQGKPVPGLFAAGEIAGGLHGQSLLPGAALTEALVLGRKAGLEAATWAQR